MNTQKTVLLSVFLTAFAIVIVYGLVTRVNSLMAAQAAPTVTQTSEPDTATPTDPPTAAPSATSSAPLSYEEAASLAAAALGRQDVYSVETTLFLGVNTYKVVFSSGDIVYVGLDRKVLGAEKPTPTSTLAPTPTQPPVIYTYQPTPTRKARSGGGSSGSVPAPNPGGGGESGED